MSKTIAIKWIGRPYAYSAKKGKGSPDIHKVGLGGSLTRIINSIAKRNDEKYNPKVVLEGMVLIMNEVFFVEREIGRERLFTNVQMCASIAS